MNAYRTPVSNRKRRRVSSPGSSRFVRGVDTLAEMAATAAGYGNTYKAGKKLVNRVRKSIRSKINAKQMKQIPSKKYSGYTRKAGNIGKTNRFSKKISKNGQMTEYGIANKGIQCHFEFRKTATGENVEGAFIGHTSLPGKQSGINFWRALVKYLMVKAGVEVRDWGKRLFEFGFGNFDVIGLQWYETSEQSTPFFTSIQVDVTTTFDKVAALLAQVFANAVGVPFDANTMRLDSIYYVPVNSPNPVATAKLGRCNVNLAQAKIAVSSISKLKVQNVTVEVAGDNEADDVTRVPLEGRIYNCKGNNVEFKSNRNCLPGLFDSKDEVALFQTFTKANATIIGGNVQNFYDGTAASDNLQTPYYKTTEMPQAWELTNCARTGKFVIQPGDIKTSTLVSKFTVSINYMFRLLYQAGVGRTGKLSYSKNLGKTRALYVEKVIGKAPTASNSLTLWTELELKQSMCIIGKLNTYTLPITYQVDY